jgi:hypothetical protein
MRNGRCICSNGALAGRLRRARHALHHAAEERNSLERTRLGISGRFIMSTADGCVPAMIAI